MTPPPPPKKKTDANYWNQESLITVDISLIAVKSL